MESQYLDRLACRVELSRQSEVDDLDLVAIGRDAQHVVRLEIKVNNLPEVHVGDRLADLAHEVDTLTFRQHVVIADDSLQQFLTCHATHTHTHTHTDRQTDRQTDAVINTTLTSRRRGVVVSGVRRMNQVNARRARLIDGWVTVFGRIYHPGM